MKPHHADWPTAALLVLLAAGWLLACYNDEQSYRHDACIRAGKHWVDDAGYCAAAKQRGEH